MKEDVWSKYKQVQNEIWDLKFSSSTCPNFEVNYEVIP